MSFTGNSNYSLVEGDWGDFRFRKVQFEDWPNVIKHVQDHFMRDEPTCKLLGYSDDFADEFEALTQKMFADDLSFLVEDKATGEIAAVRVTFRHTVNTNFDDIPTNSYSGKALFRLVDIMEKMSNLFEAFGLYEYAEFFIASCDPKYRQKGITTEMYKRNIEFLKAEGFKLVKSIFTSPYTRAAVSKLGFEEVCRLDYREFVDETGDPVFSQEELNDEHFAAVMVKLL